MCEWGEGMRRGKGVDASNGVRWLGLVLAAQLGTWVLDDTKEQARLRKTLCTTASYHYRNFGVTIWG